MPLIQNVPMLTIYRKGLINLNAEATRLMHERHTDVDLLPPGTRYAPWQLDRRAGSCCTLLRRKDRTGQYRFWSSYRATTLFAEQPLHIDRIVFRLTPHEHYLDLYTLAAELPISGKNSSLQQKSRA